MNRDACLELCTSVQKVHMNMLYTLVVINHMHVQGYHKISSEPLMSDIISAGTSSLVQVLHHHCKYFIISASTSSSLQELWQQHSISMLSCKRPLYESSYHTSLTCVGNRMSTLTRISTQYACRHTNTRIMVGAM